MKNRCQFYYYQKPSGIYYCQPISPTTGKKLFTRSTGTRDYSEAMRIINEWLVLGFPEKNKKKTVQTVDVFKNLTSLIYDNKIDIEDGLNTFFVFLNSYKEKFSSKQASSFLQTAATILDIPLNPAAEDTKKDSSEVKFVDYLLGFWNYDSSPYILKLINTGTPSDDLPQRKRFDFIHSWLKKYISYFDDKEFYLSNITSNDINAFFAYIIKLDTMTVSSLSIFASAIKQTCKFAEDENLIKNHVAKDIKQYSIEKYRKNILEKEEAETLFSSVNNFKNLEHYCINRLAIESVSRVGELQAIQLKDISIKNNKGNIDCWITISKTWDKTTHKLKKTKNKTSKTVKISNEMYLYLEKLIEQNPFKNDKNAFLFYHPAKKEMPIAYSVITREFKRALQALGFLRDGITFHSYRHLGVVILADSNYSPREIMLLTGHKTPDMVNFYANHKTKVQETKKQDMSDILCCFLEKKQLRS